MSRSTTSKFIKKRSNESNIDLEMNSLLDILVVVLIFLLLSSEQSNDNIMVPENINIPASVSSDITKRGLLVGIDKNLNIIIEDSLIKMSANEIGKNINYNENLIKTIKSENQKLKNKQKTKMKKLSFNKKKKASVVNFVIHQDIEYKYIDYIIEHLKEAGLFQLKLIVVHN